jgi:hypothetical protein
LGVHLHCFFQRCSCSLCSSQGTGEVVCRAELGSNAHQSPKGKWRGYSSSTRGGRPTGHGIVVIDVPHGPGMSQTPPSLRAGSPSVRGRVAAPSKRNSDAPAGLGVRWCRQLPDLSACASRGVAGVGLLRDHRITSDRRRSSPTS